MKMKKKFAGLAFVLLSIAIMSVTGFVYVQQQQTVKQTIINVATITLKNSALGNLEEGETKSYTKDNVTELGAAISVTTSKANVYLHLNSDINNLGTYYQTYTLTVKYITVPGGSGHSVGQTAATMTTAAPGPTAITLDAAGSWAFDFELTTTANSVSADTGTTATITVTAESI
jgi:hypothetical protein